MIDKIKSYRYGVQIEGHINLTDDLTAREIYARIYKEIEDINFAAITAIINGGDNIEYPAAETERD